MTFFSKTHIFSKGGKSSIIYPTIAKQLFTKDLCSCHKALQKMSSHQSKVYFMQNVSVTATKCVVDDNLFFLSVIKTAVSVLCYGYRYVSKADFIK